MKTLPALQLLEIPLITAHAAAGRDAQFGLRGGEGQSIVLSGWVTHPDIVKCERLNFHGLMTQSIPRLAPECFA